MRKTIKRKVKRIVYDKLTSLMFCEENLVFCDY